MKSSYSPIDNKWYRKWPESVSQHDVIYLSPPEDPAQGLPIGNGDMGALLWTESSRLVIAVNKCDTWDDSEINEFNGWSRDSEEYHTSLKHCGRLIIDFHAPVFDLLYQDNFQARLDLAGASANLEAGTPFSKVNISAFASFRHKVIVVCCDVDFSENTPVEAIFERWGSRTFAHWYSQIRRDPSIGLSGTETEVNNNTIKIFQKLRKINFVTGARIAGKDFDTKRVHSRAGKFELNHVSQNRFYIYLTAVTSENSDNPGEEVDRILNEAEKAGEKDIRYCHEQEWRGFWEDSFISLPENYMENMWHLILYYANSSSRSEYPPHFCNGLWGFNRDFVPWNFYFHWNMQYYIRPLHAANHGELAMPYYKYRYGQLPHAKDFAAKYIKKAGAFYADVSDRKGYNDAGLQYNHTPGAQIAMDFWRHYQYTGDRQFLKEMAWPVILEVAVFYEGSITKESDGKYHIRKTQAYEGSPLFDDTITDIAMIKALFPAAIKAAELVGYHCEEINKWMDISQNIVDFSLVPLENDEYTDDGNEKLLLGGLGKTQKLLLGKVFAVGRMESLKDKDSDSKDLPLEIYQDAQSAGQSDLIRNRYARRADTAYYGIPDPELAPVFPSGVIGLSDRDSEWFKAAVDQVRLHPNPTSDNSSCGDMAGTLGMCMGWCPYPIVLARLGLAVDLITAIKATISTWQIYCQGFGHYGPYSVFIKDMTLRWAANTVSDVEKDEKFLFPKWPFRHFDNEAMPIVCTAVNEMLLQSHEGVIRICPSVPHDWKVGFKLAAIDGFIIHAEFDKGNISWVCIESRWGKKCSLVDPWGESTAFCTEISSNGKVLSVKEIAPKYLKADSILEFSTVPGQRYLMAAEKDALEDWTLDTMDFKRNNNYKKLGDAQLGLPRMF